MTGHAIDLCLMFVGIGLFFAVLAFIADGHL